ncbi:RhuM family protein [Devosia sp. A16]|uniref:RhuM family protein n=1 Tax=Devosia sp. A16 TaxID=1736675 RepID=UPI0009E82857|nr:RhuM family protein [Devosia sp. A16]
MAEDPKQLSSRLAQMASREDNSVEPVHLTEDEDTGDRFLIYSTDSGLKVQLRYEGEGLFMSQAQMADLFGVDVRTVSEHVSNVFREGELEEGATIRKFRIVRTEGTREVAREVNHYNLDVVIAVGYRVSSKQGTMFRKWATDKLVQFATKGFIVDVERLKSPQERDHFRELRELIREIRASEANVYHELKQIISLCSDYAALDDTRKNAFFATVQNKLLYAIAGMTAAELRVERASAAKDNMGLTAWKGRQVRKSDIGIAKNYLGDAEIRDLNRFTNMLLDYFEQETDRRRLVLTSDAEAAVDRFIRNNDRHLLRGAGTVSKREADAHCESEYDKFEDMRRRRYLQSDEEV